MVGVDKFSLGGGGSIYVACKVGSSHGRARWTKVTADDDDKNEREPQVTVPGLFLGATGSIDSQAWL
jgi:hypothetical protein